MGFYDCRCMITGVSLKGADAALILLQQSSNQYAPMALAIKGNYNRYGSIDMIDEDANTQSILRFFHESLRSGVFIVDEEYLRNCECFPIRTIEDLLQGFERNMNDGEGAVVQKGQSVKFALIARVVWDTIAKAEPTPVEPALTLYKRLFKASPVGLEIYAESIESVSEDLYELAAVDSLLTSRGLSWRPYEEPEQHYSEEMRQYLDEARGIFTDSPTILEALRRYEQEVGELLIDDK
ncbi:MAG: hypothetical protein J2P21_27000 [Chloracidobacterium sp.]|nr:hypothetical protein [Chloracidobacterium sp.]